MRQTNYSQLLAIGMAVTMLIGCTVLANNPAGAGDDVLFEEVNGILAVEAERFYKQSLATTRAWYITSADESSDVTPDGDPSHASTASGGAYVEVLPDTRRTHDDTLTRGENFTNEPGQMAVLHYPVFINNPGRYYVWVRAYSTGTEDNGLHVGLDGRWPETGQRLQWCEGKQSWRWDSKQRTQEVHCGEPHKIYLDIEAPGNHEITFSMREDGFEFDKFMLVSDRAFARPDDEGPAVRVKQVSTAEAAPEAASGPVKKPFPKHWGSPPAIQTMDYRPLPGGYGHGSSTLAHWIQKNLDNDAKNAAAEGDQGDSQSTPLRGPDGNGAVEISGELRQWHNVILTLGGPYAHEQDNDPNPFTDFRMTVRFTHASGTPSYEVPGYFAADGEAANSSAVAGSKWRAHLSPDKTGRWHYSISFLKGRGVAVEAIDGEAVEPYDGSEGQFRVRRSNKHGRDFRSKGRLTYVGGHYLQHAGSGEYFLKAGPDAPETLLAYEDFDGTVPSPTDEQRSGEAKPSKSLHQYRPHLSDWREGDPTWKDGKGKGLIGALNYLVGKGVNTVSFLPYNAGGDGDNIWPFVERNDKLHYDCSKLDQWSIVFSHATANGLHLHFKTQENEMDDQRLGHERNEANVPEALDGGQLGPERKLYCRELIARFAHNLALNWNIGEENTQSPEEVRAMVKYLHDTDPYQHNIVIHTFPGDQDLVYTPLLGDGSLLTGTSLQNSWNATHRRTLKWIKESAKAGRPWVVANDEQGPASMGVPPDPGYQGHSGEAEHNGILYTMHDVRKLTLWGNLMAGGAGVEYYFGYQLPENDLVCEDFRSRDRSWDYCRIALEFFRDRKIPFEEMTNANDLIGNPGNDNSKFCLARAGDLYLVFLPYGGSSELDLSNASGRFSVRWFNPREGGRLSRGTVSRVRGGETVSLGDAPEDPERDWLVVVRK